MKNQPDLSTKDWLDLAWGYFQQHAQQRITLFNFFVIFSTVMTTGYISSINGSYPIMGVVVSILEILLAILFLKIEQRNKFLIYHVKEIIIGIERAHFPNGTAAEKDFSIFHSEKQKSEKELGKKIFFEPKMITHGRAYRAIYNLFLFAASFALLWAIYLSCLSMSYKKEKNIVNNAENTILDKILDSRDSLLNIKLEELSNKLQKKDSIETISK